MKKFVLGLIVALASFSATLASAADIAILNSSNYTAEFFQRRYGQDGACSVGTYLGRNEYERYYRGWKYVLDGQQNNSLIPGLVASSAPYAYDILTDADITEQRLSSVKILILSNTASMSQAQSMIIQQWVLKGGKLIATYGSGYKDIITDEREDDRLKAQKGSTGGLHELWNDPWTKAFGTQALNPVPGVDILVTKNFGPTDVPGWNLLPTKLSYGAEANLLVPRPEHYRDALAFLKLTPNSSKFNNPYPAILLNRMSRGTVVYFAYAPEFVVSLAFDLAGHCANDGNYPAAELVAPGPQQSAPLTNGFAVANRVNPQLQVMKRTLDFMITGN